MEKQIKGVQLEQDLQNSDLQVIKRVKQDKNKETYIKNNIEMCAILGYSLTLPNTSILPFPLLHLLTVITQMDCAIRKDSENNPPIYNLENQMNRVSKICR